MAVGAIDSLLLVVLLFLQEQKHEASATSDDDMRVRDAGAALTCFWTKLMFVVS